MHRREGKVGGAPYAFVHKHKKGRSCPVMTALPVTPPTPSPQDRCAAD